MDTGKRYLMNEHTYHMTERTSVYVRKDFHKKYFFNQKLQFFFNWRHSFLEVQRIVQINEVQVLRVEYHTIPYFLILAGSKAIVVSFERMAWDLRKSYYSLVWLRGGRRERTPPRKNHVLTRVTRQILCYSSRTVLQKLTAFHAWNSVFASFASRRQVQPHGSRYLVS